MIIVICVDFSAARDPQLSRLTQRIPQLFSQTADPYLEANRYLRISSRRMMPKSIQTTSEHIKEFLLWLNTSVLDTIDITDDIFDGYIDALCAYRKPCGELLSWNTVNSRVGGAYRYLLWCYGEGYCPNLAPSDVTNSYRSARRRYRVKGHPAKPLRGHVNFLFLNKAVDFVEALAHGRGGRATKHAIRNKLVGALMLQSGLRISEVTGFPLADLPEVNSAGHSTPARIIGKGGKRRVILIPNKLLIKLWEYVDIDRENICDRLRLSQPGRNIPSRLFISQAGKGVTSNWIEKLFSRASASLGIKTIPHALRHTYATYHYLINKDLAGLANLLGHSSETITRTYYVNIAVPISYAGSFSGLQDEIDKMIDHRRGAR